MSDALKLEKYSFGVGDRFAHQAKAQLRACWQAAESGVEVTPVWNKSFREHGIVGSRPASVLAAAQAAVSEPFETTREEIARIARKFLRAVQDAGAIYRHVAAAKGEGNFIAEVSMDE